MELLKIERTKQGWRSHFNGQSVDGKSQKVIYPDPMPALFEEPTPEFKKALEPFLQAIVTLVRLTDYWVSDGAVKSVATKYDKEDEQMVQIAAIAYDSSFECDLEVKTPWVHRSSLGITAMQLDELEKQAIAYSEGRRKVEQLSVISNQ